MPGHVPGQRLGQEQARLRPSVAGRGCTRPALLVHILVRCFYVLVRTKVEKQLNQLERSLTDPKEDLRTDPVMPTARASTGVNDINLEAQVAPEGGRKFCDKADCP
ncbi:hypothetical protein NDU88_009466 [Pleurodeles waltl]|uniref:Uncharacterized protein n=1 Tax=Pleurodeles waltl TaxID=8319 RepID=A0AAV7RVB3_PLEWA|nr:hypothetical protein NDU88_009466 [Pleurodeles waltl]